MHDGTVEQTRAVTTPARPAKHRDAELRAMLVARLVGVGDMGHGHQFQAAVEDAEDFVALEVKLLRIAAHLVVVGRVAETQVAVGRLKRQQVVLDALAMLRAQRTDGHHQGHERSVLLVRAAVFGQRLHPVASCVVRGFDPVFGSDHHGRDYRVFP